MAWKLNPWDKTASMPHFTFHPLVHALGTALQGVSGAVDKANLFEQLPGGGDYNARAAAKSAKTTAVPGQDATLKLLSGLGIQGADASTLMNTINRSSAISKLPQPLQQPVTDYFTKQEQAKAQQPFIDPMMMQMFFANTIAPYMQQFSQGTTKQLSSMYDDELKNLPSDPLTRSLMQQLIPQEKAAAVGESQTNANALGPASAIQTLMQQLQSSQQSQLQYAADIRNNLAQNALGSLLGGAGGASPFTAPATPTK